MWIKNLCLTLFRPVLYGAVAAAAESDTKWSNRQNGVIWKASQREYGLGYGGSQHQSDRDWNRAPEFSLTLDRPGDSLRSTGWIREPETRKNPRSDSYARIKTPLRSSLGTDCKCRNKWPVDSWQTDCTTCAADYIYQVFLLKCLNWPWRSCNHNLFHQTYNCTPNIETIIC